MYLYINSPCEPKHHNGTMNLKTYNIELSMSKETRDHWLSLLAQARDAFNLCSSIVFDGKVPLSIASVHGACYDKVRQAIPSLPSQGVIRAQKSVLAALRSIRANKHHIEEAPQKKHLSMQLDKRLYSNLSKQGIKLESATRRKRELCEFILFPKVEELFDTCTFKDPTIFERDGRLFLSVPFEVPSLPCKDDTAVGVDLGMKRLFVTSEGNAFKDKEYLARRRRLRYLKRCLQSKGTHSAKRHLKKVSRKEHNVSRDMVERSTNVLLRSTKASDLVLEDLKRIKVNTSKSADGFKKKRHNSAFAQVPLYLFKERLTAKAPLYGRKVETVSPYMTSQTDSRTNKRDGLRKGCRYYCSDGKVLDADLNAAVNIALRSNHPISKVEPIDGRLNFLHGQARVRVLNVMRR